MWYAALAKLCDLLPSAPLFPVDDTAELFSFLAPLLTRHPHYRRINRALNEAAALAPGGIGKAKLSRQRAVQLLRAEDLLGALDEIHSMKMSLWSGDTLEDSLQTMLFAAQTYAQLNLHLAAKQHALTAATVAQSTGRSDVSNSSHAASSEPPSTTSSPGAGSAPPHSPRSVSAPRRCSPTTRGTSNSIPSSPRWSPSNAEPWR